jgi:N6-adenosine-specific RNA methylase IME4
MVLVGKRGKPPAPEGTKLDSIFTGPVDRDHSKKPETLQDWIDTAWPDMPKLELFARRKRPHWDVYGNEVEDSI